jgi:hypothetical protein
MNSTPQLDFHPDAEALSAFAEHLLPEHERQPILAHLATCDRCRQILFLAQDANPDSESQAQSPPARPVLVQNLGRKRPSLRNWPLAAGALAACAALVAFSVYLYPRHSTPPPQQTARSASPTPPVPTGARPAPLQFHAERDRHAPARPSAPQTRPSAPAPRITTSTAPIAQANETVEVSAAAQATPQSANQTVTVDVSSQSVLVQPAPPPVTATIPAKQILPSDELALQTRNIKTPEAKSEEAKSLAPAQSGGATGSASIHGFSAGHGGAVGAGGGRLSAPRAALARMAPRPLAVSPEDESAARNTLQRTLPSGLPAISAVSANHHLLALDSAGTLFLSDDAGLVWEAVPQSWPGRAMRISILSFPSNAMMDTPSSSAGSSPHPPNAQSQTQPQQPLLRFEIVTDLGARWTSFDGRIWKTQ